jgi:salicylate hydroxylase
MRVHIIGRRLQGQIAALCCAHAGLGDIHLFDTGEVDKLPVVELPPNATRILFALGLRPALDEMTYLPMSELYRTASTGYGLVNRPLGPFVEQRYGSTHVHVRTRTLALLLDQVLVSKGVAIHGQIGSAPEPADVVLTADPGSHADGVFPALPAPTPTNWETAVAWSDQTGGPLINWSDEGCYARQIPVREGTCTVLVRDQPMASAQTERRLRISEALDWKPVPTAAWSPDWWADQHVLLGDVAHPLPPFGGQDFALAVEDAWVIARMLALYDDHLPTALGEYERFRRPRALRFRTHLETLAAGHAERNSLRRLAGNWGLALRYRLLPELAMQRDDWQFEYDCVKGFD